MPPTAVDHRKRAINFVLTSQSVTAEHWRRVTFADSDGSGEGIAEFHA
jgi:hypothetical protein